MTTNATNKNSVRVRIAPSPTGPFHLGTARTALFNFLFARKHEGVFVLRIEDTDKERSEKKWEENIIEGLQWLELEWDEFYRQSERIELYRKYLEKLLEEGKAFYCWHTSGELEKEKEEQEAKHEAPRHVCEFREEKQHDATEAQKQSGIIRIKNDAEALSFKDLIRGEITFDMRLLGDFSIAKNPTEPLYNFAAVIDDFEMQISHVIRGEDHISNTPKQIFLQQIVGLPTPAYAHLPLILGPDRSKLSKRHGSTALLEYRDMGYLPEALCNFMAFLGWSPDADEEVLPRKELIRLFDMSKVQASGAIFNLEKLDWMNGRYIRNMQNNELTARCIPYLISAKLIHSPISNFQFPISKQILNSKFQISNSGEEVSFDWLQRIVALEQERMKKLSEIGERAGFFFVQTPQYDKELLHWKDMSDEQVQTVLQTLIESIGTIPSDDFADAKKLEAALMPLAEQEQNRGVLLWPLRVALSGQRASPGPFDIMSILGKEKTLARLEHAKGLLT